MGRSRRLRGEYPEARNYLTQALESFGPPGTLLEPEEILLKSTPWFHARRISSPALEEARRDDAPTFPLQLIPSEIRFLSQEREVYVQELLYAYLYRPDSFFTPERMRGMGKCL